MLAQGFRKFEGGHYEYKSAHNAYESLSFPNRKQVLDWLKSQYNINADEKLDSGVNARLGNIKYTEGEIRERARFTEKKHGGNRRRTGAARSQATGLCPLPPRVPATCSMHACV